MSKLSTDTTEDESKEEFYQDIEDAKDILKDFSLKKLINEIKQYINHDFSEAILEIDHFLKCDWLGQEKKLAKVFGAAILYAGDTGNDNAKDYLLAHPKCEELLLQGYPYFLSYTDCSLE